MPLTLLLQCLDIEQTRSFYSMLGFEVRHSADGTLSAEKFGGTLIFTSTDLWDGTPRFSGTIYFSALDVDGYFSSVKDKVAVAWSPQDMSYGSREFGVRDCNGYHLAFRQPVSDSVSGAASPPPTS